MQTDANRCKIFCVVLHGLSGKFFYLISESYFCRQETRIMNEQRIKCCRCHIPSSVLHCETKSGDAPRPWGWCKSKITTCFYWLVLDALAEMKSCKVNLPLDTSLIFSMWIALGIDNPCRYLVIVSSCTPSRSANISFEIPVSFWNSMNLSFMQKSYIRVVLKSSYFHHACYLTLVLM
jgi:hypothetical protein